nr:hypothetical protein [uncultured bacterium]
MSQRSVPVILSVAFVALAFDIASAEETTPPPANVESESSASRHLREALLGIDADQDGIRDDLQILLDAGSTVSRDTGVLPSKVASAFADAFAQPPRQTPSLSGSRCLDYLLLDPKDQSAADRYIRSRSGGTFGSHPCDPFISPLIERPFDAAIVQTQLGPLRVDYSHLE